VTAALRVSAFTPWYPDAEAPWQGTFVRHKLEALHHLGVDVRVLKLRRGRAGFRVHEVDLDGRRTPRPARVGLGAAHLAALVRRRQLWDEPCDVVLAEGVWATTLLRAVPLPLLGVLHGADPMTLSGARRDPVRRALTARALRRTDGLVAVGAPVMRGLPPDLRGRTTVIENGVPPGVFPRRRVPAGARFAAPDFPHLVTVGNVDTHKNQELLLRGFPAIRRVWPRARWTVVGDGPDRRRLQALRDRTGLTDAVRFTGRLPPAEVAAVLAGCDLFVLPSLREAFGCAYLEAMAVGVPTLVSRRAGLAALVDDERLVDPTDLGDIIGRARAVLGSEAGYSSAVAAGHAVAERCSWTAHAERLSDVLFSCIRPSRVRS
jgi:glycosyltransferase involved in cell wall biosynthesis